MDFSFITVWNNLSAIIFVWASILLICGVGLGTFLNQVISAAERQSDTKCHGKRLYSNFIWAANLGLIGLMVLSPIIARWMVDSLLVVNVFLTFSLGTCSYHIYQWWNEHKLPFKQPSTSKTHRTHTIDG